MIVVLTGLAGTGKTALLAALSARGQQTLDLERLANHRGSVFGGLGRPAQPSHATFQMAVRAAIARADPRRPLWIEDEADFIGAVGVPPELVERMRAAPCVEVRAPSAERIGRILAEYGDRPVHEWLAAVGLIATRLGVERTVAVRGALTREDRPRAVRILLDYYDSAYRHRIGALARPTLGMVAASDVDATVACVAALTTPKE